MKPTKQAYTKFVETMSFDGLKLLLKFFTFVPIVSSLLIVLSAKSALILEGVAIKQIDVQFVLF